MRRIGAAGRRPCGWAGGGVARAGAGGATGSGSAVGTAGAGGTGAAGSASACTGAVAATTAAATGRCAQPSTSHRCALATASPTPSTAAVGRRRGAADRSGRRSRIGGMLIATAVCHCRTTGRGQPVPSFPHETCHLPGRLADGQLIVVSSDLTMAHHASAIVTRLQLALDHWNFFAPQLQDLAQTLELGKARHAFPFEPRMCMAPLPRACRVVDVVPAAGAPGRWLTLPGDALAAAHAGVPPADGDGGCGRRAPAGAGHGRRAAGGRAGAGPRRRAAADAGRPVVGAAHAGRRGGVRASAAGVRAGGGDAGRAGARRAAVARPADAAGAVRRRGGRAAWPIRSPWRRRRAARCWRRWPGRPGCARARW